MAFPSSFIDIQSAVIAKARLDTVADTPKVKDWINQAYSQVCVEAEPLTTFATMTLTANVASYTFPATVARVKEMFVTPAGQTTVVGEQPPMTRTTLDAILQRRQGGQGVAQSGAYSRLYALVGEDNFEVWPTPAGADVITLYYVAFPTALSANTDLPVIDEPYASKLLEYGALVQAGDFKGDPATDGWQIDYDQWMARYMGHLDAKRGDIPVQGHQWGGLSDTRGLYGW